MTINVINLLNNWNSIPPHALKLLINSYLDRKLPFKRIRKFSIDRWVNQERYEEYRYDLYNQLDKFLNIGVENNFYHPRWECYKDHKSLDLENKNNSYQLVYSANYLQSINPIEVRTFLSTIYHLLCDQGIARFLIMDSDLAYYAYKEKRIDFFQFLCPRINLFDKHDFLIELLIASFVNGSSLYKEIGNIDLGKKIRGEFSKLDKEHFLDFLLKINTQEKKYTNLNWFNYEKLNNLLSSIGFKSVYKSGFSQSLALPMREVPLFDCKFPFSTLYVEAVK